MLGMICLAAYGLAGAKSDYERVKEACDKAAKEGRDSWQEKISIRLFPGAFAENILCEGIDLYKLPVGTKLRIGTALCEVTQIGKECHADCAIRRQAGDCVMPREGIFVIVLEEGDARPGDRVCVTE